MPTDVTESKLKVGDRLWWVPDRGEAGEVVVKKVGRKWATVGKDDGREWMDNRIDYQNPQMPADGVRWQSHGRCYRTKEEYELTLQCLALWREVRQYFRNSYQVPAHLDVDDLEGILQILKGAG